MSGFIREINIDNIDEWNDTVRSFPDYEVFYLNEYSAAFMHEDKKNGIPILLLYEKNKDRAINVVFKRDVADDERFTGKINNNEYFDLITPYGYGGFWGDINDYDSLNKEYSYYCLDSHYICEFVRFELFNDYYKHYDGEVETRTHNVVRNLDMSIDEIWMDFKQKVRKNVKRARCYDLTVDIDYHGEKLDEFLDIYYSTMDRNRAANDYYFKREFFEKLISMKDNAVFFHVKYDDKVISSELVIYGGRNCYSYLGGTYSEYYDMRPNDFLKFEIIKWAKEKGLCNFVLGGGYGSDDGIFEYKKCLSPNGIQNFYIGRRIFSHKQYDKLVKMNSVNIERKANMGFFPLYRA